MNYTPKAQRAQEILAFMLAHDGTVSTEQHPTWSLSGNSSHNFMLKLLAKEGAIRTVTTRGRNGGSVHTITDEGRWLEDVLRRNALTDTANWKKNADTIKWTLLLPESENRSNGIRAHMLQDCERVAITEAWRGSVRHRATIEVYGTIEAKGLLQLTQLIPGKPDISIGESVDETMDIVEHELSENTGLSITGLRRIAMLALYKLITFTDAA